MDLLDIATVRDVRTGIYAKKPRVSVFNLIRYTLLGEIKWFWNEKYAGGYWL